MPLKLFGLALGSFEGLSGALLGEVEAVGEGPKVDRKAEANTLGALRVGDGDRSGSGIRADTVKGNEGRVSRDSGNSGPNILGFRWRFLGTSLVEGFILLPFPKICTFSFLSLDDLFSALIFLEPPENPKGPFLAATGENAGVVGVEGSEGEVVPMHNGLDSFLAFFACRLRTLSSSSDDGQVLEFLRERWSSDECTRNSCLASWAKVPKNGVRLAPAEGVSLGGGTGTKPSSCIKR